MTLENLTKNAAGFCRNSALRILYVYNVSHDK